MQEEDLVNHPSHYAGQGEVECKELLKVALSGYEGYVSFCVGNVIKYCWRCHGKEPVRSLKSARWYFNEACDILCSLPKDEALRLTLKARACLMDSNTAHRYGDLVTPQNELYDKVLVQMAKYFDERELYFFRNIVEGLVDCGLYRDSGFPGVMETGDWNTDSFNVAGKMLDDWIIYLGG